MRTISIVLLLIILGALFYFTGGEQTHNAVQTQSVPAQNDNSFKDLKIN